jgi:hypothetical protein
LIERSNVVAPLIAACANVSEGIAYSSGVSQIQQRIRRDLHYVVGILAVAGVLGMLGHEQSETVAFVAVFVTIPIAHMLLLSLREAVRSSLSRLGR